MEAQTKETSQAVARWCLNVKQRHELSSWLSQTEQERQNAGADHGILVVKRQGHNTGAEQYAVMRLEDMVKLLKEAGYGDTK
jgi:hypothetical protein